MKSTLSDIYDKNFYSRYLAGMTNSAESVLGILYKFYKPQSVVDVGCGRGAWLAAAESLGSTKLKGFDGGWIKKGDLISQNIDFTIINFEDALPVLDEKYDLCISLEVAEHISEKYAKNFVDHLCEASDVVLFSGAIKYQGGDNHVNEQWQSYWIDLFKSNGYECFDVFRASLWTNEAVEWWYRQNILLFSRPQNDLINNEQLRAAEKPIFDIVHPKNYEGKIEGYRNKIAYPTLAFCFGCAKRYITIKIKRLIGKA